MILAETTTSSLEAPEWWAWAFVAFAAVLVLYHTIDGWKVGCFRKLSFIIALAAGYLSAYFSARDVGLFLDVHLDYPLLLLNLVGGALVGTAAFLVLLILFSEFVPGKDDIENGFIRTLTTLGGALVGAGVGLAYAALLLISINVAGSLSELSLQADYEAAMGRQSGAETETLPQTLDTPPPASSLPLVEADASSLVPTDQGEAPLPPADNEGEAAIQRANAFLSALHERNQRLIGALSNENDSDFEPNPALVFLTRLRHGLASSPVQEVMTTIDPIPDTAYRVLSKAQRLMHDDDALQRFADHPLSQQMLTHRYIQELRNDADIQRLARARAINSLLKHPKIIQASNNRELQAMVRYYDLEKVLDDALAGH